MANVISELFKDIADSIRYKTGETGTMKPAEFPAEIMSIVTGGGSSGGESGGESGGGIVVSDKWIFDAGEFFATQDTHTIEHTLGRLPDIVYCHMTISSELSGSKAVLLEAVTTSENLLGNATNEAGAKKKYGFAHTLTPSTNTLYTFGVNSIENLNEANFIFPTENTIKFGATGSFIDVILSRNYKYAWIAFAKTTTSSGGGGSSGESSDLVKHVTFIGADGTQLYRMPVLKGDNCKDPVANGNIATPTKESTVNTVYTFSGWSLTQGGNANSAALSNVTEDRTVYVAFKASTRTYTVRFYDGDTLVNTQQVAYGGSSSYTYSKKDYVFNGWIPEPTNVTSDMDCYAQMDMAQFKDLDWYTIAQMSEAGRADASFNIGDTKTVTLTWENGATEDVVFEIADLAKDVNYDTKKPVITLITKNLLLDKQVWGESILNQDTHSYDYYYDYYYDDIPIKQFLTETVFNALPSELRSVLKRTASQYHERKGRATEDIAFYIRPVDSENIGYAYNASYIKVDSRYTYSIFDNTSTSRIKRCAGTPEKWALAGDHWYGHGTGTLSHGEMGGVGTDGNPVEMSVTDKTGVCFLLFI